jgi:protein O-GlcNAc transferase
MPPFPLDAGPIEATNDADDGAHARLTALIDQGESNTATELGRQHCERHPGDAIGWKLLGIAAQRSGRLPLALSAKRRAAALDPASPEAHNNLGNALAAAGQLDDALAALQQALALDPAFAEAHNNLGLVLQRLERPDEAAHHFEQAVALRPTFAEAHSNLLFMLSHDARLSPAALLAAHRRFDDLHGRPHARHWRPHANGRQPDRRLRVGFVSGDLRRHAVARFLAPLWRGLDRDQVEVLAYSTAGPADETTGQLRALTDAWADVGPLADDALADRIRHDAVDILVDLSGHTRHNRLPVFARKPAPVQVTAIGYPNTTGLSAIDYRISDAFRMPPQLARLNVEHIAYVPCASTFEHEDAPDVSPLPARQTGRFTFGSFQRPSKISAQDLVLWARVLHAVPGSTLLVGAMDASGARYRIVRALADQGIDPGRIGFVGQRPFQAYLGLHRHIDLMLDTHPYPGGTTTHHALWMGVPTLTLTGSSLVSWQGAAVLRRVGLDEFVAHDPSDYVKRATRWATDLDSLAALRAGLRERIATAPHLQAQAVANGMQAALRMMWHRWCAGLPPASFEVRP